MSVKFTKAEIAEIVEAGTVKGGNLILSLAWLQGRESSTRVKGSVKADIFRDMLVARGCTVNEDGTVNLPEGQPLVLSAKDIRTPRAAGALPATYVVNQSVWAGRGEAATLAYRCGLSAAFSQVPDEEFRNVVTVTLAPLTPEDRERRAKLEAAHAAKGAPSGDDDDSDEGAPETATAEA
jgi:hypothetical protein